MDKEGGSRLCFSGYRAVGQGRRVARGSRLCFSLQGGSDRKGSQQGGQARKWVQGESGVRVKPRYSLPWRRYRRKYRRRFRRCSLPAPV